MTHMSCAFSFPSTLDTVSPVEASSRESYSARDGCPLDDVVELRCELAGLWRGWDAEEKGRALYVESSKSELLPTAP